MHEDAKQQIVRNEICAEVLVFCEGKNTVRVALYAVSEEILELSKQPGPSQVGASGRRGWKFRPRRGIPPEVACLSSGRSSNPDENNQAIYCHLVE